MIASICDATLVVIPCSSDKRQRNASTVPVSILDRIDARLGTALATARAAIRERARVDERTLMPAFQRYSGEFYEHGADAVRGTLSRGARVVIISGGYGLLLAEERIGEYDYQFSPARWPRGLLQECLLDYARREHLQNVIAILSTSTGYARLVRRTRWREAGFPAVLLTPVAGPGSMKKAPRAEGQALLALVNGQFSESWRSTDGLAMREEKLGV